MILGFKTKRDINGNTYYLRVNTDKRTYNTQRGYYTLCVTVGKRELSALEKEFIVDGFTEEDTL